MNQHGTKHSIENLMALMLFGVFAVSILGVLLLGVNGYHRLTERDQKAYHIRTCAQYLMTRVRQADHVDGIAVEQFGGGDCLLFTEEIDGVRYTTRVYCYEGTLRELLTQEGTALSPESGETILEAQCLSVTLAEGLLTAVICGEDGESAFQLSLRSGEVQS